MGRAIKPSGGGRQAAPSMSVQMAKQQKEMLRAGALPDDIGLMEGTLIMPTGNNMPSWFGNFGGRWRLEKKRMKLRAAEYYVMFMYKFWMVRPRPRLDLREVPQIAQHLHKEVYTHFAAGSLSVVEPRICEGFLNSLKRRVAQRPPNTSLWWTVHKYLSRPKTVSYKAAYYPPQKGELKTERNGIQQVVVRIHSLQSLQHVKRLSGRDKEQRLYMREVVVDAQGREIPELQPGAEPKDAKESVEYIVVQKSLRNGKMSPWMVWGTAEETTLEKLRQDEKKSMRQMVTAQS